MTHALYTGPVKADVSLSDGTVVDVRPEVVYLDTQEQAVEAAQLIGLLHQEHGHPYHDHGDPFVYVADPEKG